MATEVSVYGEAEQSNGPPNLADQALYPLKLNSRGDILVAQSLPPSSALVRLGKSYQVQTTTARAALNALPTTIATLSLYNGEPANGASYLIDTIAMVCTTSFGAANLAQLVAMLNKVASISAAPTDAANSIRSLNGKSQYSGRARTVENATVVNDGWFPEGQNCSTALATTVGLGVQVPVYGKYVVPPGGQFNLSAVAAVVATGLFQFFVTWHEIQLPVVT